MLSRKSKDKKLKEAVVGKQGKYVKKENPNEIPSLFYIHFFAIKTNF